MASLTNDPVKTFSVGFNYEPFNELPYARSVAASWNTEHTERIVTPDNAEDILWKLIRHFDEPFADPCAFQTYYLAQETRRHVTVALNGDGGDETFAGYPRYWMDRYMSPYFVLPAIINRRMIPLITDLVPEPTNIPIETNWIMGMKRLAQAAGTSSKASIIRWGSYFGDEMKGRLLNRKMRSLLDDVKTESILEEWYDQADADTLLDRTLFVDTMNYLPGNNLAKMDRMTMAHGLEARSPLLDTAYIELVARLPGRMKLRGLQTKYLLRKTFQEYLPTVIQDRNKRGFAAPVEEWLKYDLKPMMDEMVLSANACIGDYTDLDYVKRLASEHQKGQINHGKRLWALLIFEVWCRAQQTEPCRQTG